MQLITKSISHQLDNSDAILTASSFNTSKYMHVACAILVYNIYVIRGLVYNLNLHPN